MGKERIDHGSDGFDGFPLIFFIKEIRANPINPSNPWSILLFVENIRYRVMDDNILHGNGSNVKDEFGRKLDFRECLLGLHGLGRFPRR
jgi:hypothetical protein